jgi:hypothetical protein
MWFNPGAIIWMRKKSLYKSSRETGDLVTPKMIVAGVKKWEAWQSGDNPYPETLVKIIYRAMRRASGQCSC